jgi:FkbM family methyltransferase
VRGGDAKGLWLLVQPRTHKFGVTGRYEPTQYAEIRRHLPHGGTFWDVGAHVGLIAVPIAALGIEVVAIEAHPANLERLQAVVARNKLGNLRVVGAAAGESNRRVRISDGESSSEGRVNDTEGSEVEMLTLDSLLDVNPAPDVVKIDVEGYEGRVLEGATRLLRDVHTVFLIELHPWAENSAVTRNRLLSADYVIQDISERHVLATPRRKESKRGTGAHL